MVYTIIIIIIIMSSSTSADIEVQQSEEHLNCQCIEESLNSTGSVSSFGSQTSVYSGAGGKGDYDITGEVLMGVYYKSNQLYIHIERARGLAAAKSNGYSNPYIKTYLLSDKAKHTKKKTNVKKETLDPVYNETLSVS